MNSLFMYFSIVYLIYGAAKSQIADTKNISLRPLNVMGVSIHPKAVILILTVLVILGILVTE